jgi:hypothetical protein
LVFESRMRRALTQGVLRAVPGFLPGIRTSRISASAHRRLAVVTRTTSRRQNLDRRVIPQLQLPGIGVQVHLLVYPWGAGTHRAQARTGHRHPVRDRVAAQVTLQLREWHDRWHQPPPVFIDEAQELLPASRPRDAPQRGHDKRGPSPWPGRACAVPLPCARPHRLGSGTSQDWPRRCPVTDRHRERQRRPSWRPGQGSDPHFRSCRLPP